MISTKSVQKQTPTMKRKSKAANIGSGKPDNRAPVIEDRHERIRRRAYELWEQGGCQHGMDTEHWLQAEKEISGGQS